MSLMNPSYFMLKVSNKTLQQVKTFKYLGVVFTSDGKQNTEIDTGNGKANAVLIELYRIYGYKIGAFNHTKAVSLK